MQYALPMIALLIATVSACASAPPAPDCPVCEPAAATAPTTSAPAEFDARLSLYDYPYEVQTFAFTSQGEPLEMAYMDVAPTAELRGVVVLLHGKNFSGAYWARTIEALTAQGYRVVVPDQIGFGKSSKPRNYQFTFQALAANTQALLTKLGVTEATIVGHSMGGMLATRFALMYPEVTRQLVMVNPIGLEDWKLVVPYTDIEQAYANELKATPDSVRAYMQASYFDGQWKPEYDDLAAIQIGWTESADRELLAWVAAATADMVLTQPVLYEFDQLKVPTLLIIGDRDRTALGKPLVAPEVAATMGLYGELGPRTQQAIAGSELVVLDNIGHVPQFEDWDRYIAALTTFLAK